MDEKEAKRLLLANGKSEEDTTVFLGCFAWQDTKLPDTEELLLDYFGKYMCKMEELRAMFKPKAEDKFDKMTLAELCAWYEENMGYDPVADDPSQTELQVRELCRALDDEIRGEDYIYK